MSIKRKAEKEPAGELRQRLDQLPSPELRLIHHRVFDDYEAPAPELAGELLRERGEEQSPPGDCPLCGGTLEQGGVHVQRPLASWAFMNWLTMGLFRPSAQFRSEKTGRKQTVIGAWSRSAARCTDCGTLLVRSS